MGRHGENIHKRKDGRWEARVIVSDSCSGKSHYRYLYGKSYQEAKRKKKFFLENELTAVNSADDSDGHDTITFAELMKEWLRSRRGAIKESSYIHYENLLEQHIFPALGNYDVSELTTSVLDSFLKELLTSGRSDKTGGLSAKTVADIRSLLLMGMEYARRQEYACNVTDKLFYPRIVNPDIRILTRAEQNRLEQILFCSQECIAIGILLALYGGLRIGEICALQWQDINPEDATVRIPKTILRIRDLTPDAPTKTKVIIDRPKTACSLRLVPIPSFILHHISQFTDYGEHYILTGSDTFIEPRICLARYKSILKQAGIDSLTFHTLRHTFATRCVESGFDIKSLSEILGHANVNTTLQRYVHPSMELKRSQMEKLELFSIHSQM